MFIVIHCGNIPKWRRCNACAQRVITLYEDSRTTCHSVVPLCCAWRWASSPSRRCDGRRRTAPCVGWGAPLMWWCAPSTRAHGGSGRHKCSRTGQCLWFTARSSCFTTTHLWCSLCMHLLRVFLLNCSYCFMASFL